MPSVIFFLISATCAAAGNPKPVLEVEVRLHHSVQWTRVYASKEGWYCATEHNPMYPLERRPKSLDRMRESVESIKNCRETFSARLQEGKSERKWSGCRDVEAKTFLNELGKDCGRF